MIGVRARPICACILFGGVIAVSGPASAQALGQASNGTSPAASQHRDYAGKPCLTTAGEARPHVANPHIFDHVLTLTNHCSDIIKVKICYYHSDECVAAAVPGHGRKEAVLGSFPALSLFRYEIREQF